MSMDLLFEELLQATWHNNYIIVNKLVSAGVLNLNIRSKIGVTALHVATYRFDGDLRIIRRLLLAGAEIDKQESHHGWTALHIAAGCGFVPVVDLLLRNNANPFALDKTDATAMDIAYCCNQGVIIGILISAEAGSEASQTYTGSLSISESKFGRAIANIADEVD